MSRYSDQNGVLNASPIWYSHIMRTQRVKKVVIIVGVCTLLFTFLFFIRGKKSVPRFRIGVSLVDAYRSCIESTKPQQEKGLCLKELAEYASRNSTAGEIDTAIGSLTKPDDLAWCHEFMHYAGWGVYKQTKNISNSFAVASSKCDSGMFHGIVEEYINEKSEGKEPEQFIITSAPTACEDDVAKNDVLPSGHVKGYCYHGLGHAFMFITNNDLPRSLRYCDALPPYYSAGCYTGAFMENLQSKQVGRPGTHPSAYTPKSDDPDYPCNILDNKYRDFCYRYAGIAVGVRTKGDFKEAFASCLKLSPAYRNICFWGVGSSIPAPQWSSRWAGEKCKLALEVNADAYRQCILGGMSFLMQLNLGDPHAVDEFCGAIATNYRDICYVAAGENFRAWIKSDGDLKEKCNQLFDIGARGLCAHGDSRRAK